DVSALYDQKCGICHGRDGKLMVGGAPDLTKSSLSLAERITLITNGKGTMPPQKDILSQEQIVALAKYVEKFR
ncbi:MAG: cytochrome c, partial [Flavobacteriales bacterium]|nr:cytochrome c [Flavobacteriales bacterium]